MDSWSWLTALSQDVLMFPTYSSPSNWFHKQNPNPDWLSEHTNRQMISRASVQEEEEN